MGAKQAGELGAELQGGTGWLLAVTGNTAASLLGDDGPAMTAEMQ